MPDEWEPEINSGQGGSAHRDAGHVALRRVGVVMDL
jgi:hypothetical protein